ncbi:sigma-70 family RNA polymerase sigma factor [Nocardia terpenica]|uniref:sigma-70 family RNA polymerase sigma factor n=1 Tax=Nocardia terpenica TaxID=455432 RepID=UPI001895127E|nr:sigma-70 family RNA polymerase sigma factor [Nocardia terpenica]MBF6063342.1 sigma-70 family RNA polymerase sigma factor [Nocardia terpenica]MBF6105898.1 sigma-70 family RNA polymerase sigma factor [Nocardia terpenica]MBF6113518.1 sigma-70 family RNA polymerase sigma factor [Nocardia terpenica]MBF6119639.1 sigma-70 family RNA polymerase sigma factor [Nocardia terpenica]MBF6152050.1 sigma-70 family RNA polymerase sigma factor [Nocardia terpenica]
MDNELGQRFEQHRDHVRMVAYRMLGSLAEAEDAVQEAWLRLGSVDADGIGNLAGWLTTVVSRVCLDMLRARRFRREDLVGHDLPGGAGPVVGDDPEHEAVLVDSVGRAVLVVLDRLGPDERIAFVLHDMFAVPFDEIAPLVERSVSTTKKLASRARRKVRGHSELSAEELARRRRVVEAFLAASRAGDLDAVVEVLSPTVIRRADRYAIADDRPGEVRGARAVAGEVAVFGRGARFATAVLVDGSVGLAVAPHGRLRLVVVFTIDGDRIAEYRLVADPGELERLELAVLA